MFMWVQRPEYAFETRSLDKVAWCYTCKIGFIVDTLTMADSDHSWPVPLKALVWNNKRLARATQNSCFFGKQLVR